MSEFLFDLFVEIFIRVLVNDIIWFRFVCKIVKYEDYCFKMRDLLGNILCLC